MKALILVHTSTLKHCYCLKHIINVHFGNSVIISKTEILMKYNSVKSVINYNIFPFTLNDLIGNINHFIKPNILLVQYLFIQVFTANISPISVHKNL
jgi:hypothetical protein